MIRAYQRLFALTVLGLLAFTLLRASPSHAAEEPSDAATPRLETQLAEVGGSVAFSPDGLHVLSSFQNTAVLWEIATARVVRRFDGHTERVSAVAFSPDGRFVLTGSWDKTVRLWETVSGRVVRSFNEHADSIQSVAFSPDAQYVLSRDEYTPRLWNAATGQEVRSFGEKFTKTFARFSPNGRYVLSGSGREFSAVLWDTATAQEVSRFGNEDGLLVGSLEFSPDGRFLVAGGIQISGAGSSGGETESSTVRLWETESGREIRRLDGNGVMVTSVAFSPDGRFVLAGIIDRTDSQTGRPETSSAWLWETQTGREVRRFDGQGLGAVFVGFSPDERFVLTGGEGSVHVWEMNTGLKRNRFEHDGSLSSARFSPNGRFLLTHANNSARLVQMITGAEVTRFEGYAAGARSVAFSPDGRHILTAGISTAQLWDITTGRGLHRFEGHTGSINYVAFSPDSRYVLSGSVDNTSRLWETASGHEVRRFQARGNLLSTGLSPDGRYVVIGEDFTGRFWETVTGKEIRRFEPTTKLSITDSTSTAAYSGFFSLALSSDGQYVLTGSERSHTAVLWETATGRELRHFTGTSNVAAVAFSPDDQYLLTGGDKVAQMWETATGKEVRRFIGHSGWFTSLAFSRDGRYVLSGSDDRTARLWETMSGREVRRFEGHARAVSSVAFSEDGRYILTGSLDNIARLWSSETAGEIARLVSFADGSWAVISPDGRFDTTNLEEIKGLHWVMPDDPLHALPLEIFMRDYYEPRLLARLLAREKFVPIRSVATLNRAQPKVQIVGTAVEDAKTGTVTVTVEVAEDTRTVERDGKPVLMKSGAYDLRLFREGQLVGQWPAPTLQAINPDSLLEEELDQWRGDHRIALDPKTGKRIVTFRGIRLPRRSGLKEVEFSAYAFNEDRVKSETARTKIAVPQELTPRPARAYVITVGVNAFESESFDLSYAASDAREFGLALQSRLQEIVDPATSLKRFEEVVWVPLISDAKSENGQRVLLTNTATKDRIHAVLDKLANKPVSPERLADVPQAERLASAQPEDLVLIAFSTHGDVDQRGRFYLLPHDIGAGHDKTPDQSIIRRKAISSEELSAWLLGVDAGDLAMVVDACHSAASVNNQTFKPGPMGSRGLGQLAYDKGMRILAATQVDQYAFETQQIRQGLLSYALVHEGLTGGSADFKPKDEQILLSEWLSYGSERVPSLYREWREGKLAARATLLRPFDEPSLQQPALFDFARTRDVIVGNLHSK